MKKHFTHRIITILITLFSGLHFASVQAQSFVHPGGLHTQADLDRMKAKVAAGAHPWIDDWNKLITDPEAQNTYKAKPQANMGVSRQQADNDAHAAYLNTLRWYISGDTTYANCAVRICNAWAYTVNQVPTGTDIPGLSGISIFDMALVGELLRVYNGWTPADFTQFKNMMLNYYYPVCNSFLTNHNGTCISSYWANWDACNTGAILTIGVLCDDTAKYNQAVNYFKNGAGNGSINNAVAFINAGNLGQWQESGRDQEHAQLGVGLLGSLCQVAWNQGLDLFSYNNNRLLAGAEYVARTNLSFTVPYQTYNNCDGVNQYYLSTNGLGRLDDRPVYELLYNHYVVLQGLSAPNVRAMADLQRPEHGSTDHFGYGTLTFTLDGTASPYPAAPIAPIPTGLVATAGVSQVSLDWAAPSPSTAQGYNILRSTTSGGPYTSISSWTANTYPHYVDNTVTNGTTYYYVISAANQAGTSATTSPVSAEPVAATATLPTGWARKDVGAVTTAGNANYSATSNTWIVSGSGSDVGGTADSHSYVFTSVSGDFTITTRLANVNWVGSADKVGLVMRETLNPNSKRLTINLGETGDRLARFGTRSTIGGNTTWQEGDQYTWVPVWFRLQRSGNTFTAYQSSDGVTWFTIGTSTFAMANVYYAGLSVCAGSTSGALNTSTFDNVTLTGGASSAPLAPASFTATALNNSQINLLWTTSAGASAYEVKRSLSASGPFTTIAPSFPDTTFLDTGLVVNTTYYYSIKAVNLAGESTDSTQTSVQTLSLTLPPAPAGFSVVAGNSRVSLSWTATLHSPTGYNIKRANTIAGPYTTIKSVAATSYIDSTAVNDSLYYYTVSAVNALGEGPGSTPAVVFVGKKLTGTIIGTAGSYNNNSATTKTAAMDGNLATYFDSPTTNGSWVGLDLSSDSSAVIKLISFAPRSGYPQRMTGGIFQGANAADFSDAVNLYTIATQPAIGALIPVTVSNTGLFRYLRYLSPNGSNGDIAEINFFGDIQKGRSIPIAPSGLTAGVVKAKAVLNWAATTDAVSYNIKRASVSGGPYATIMTADTLTTYTDASVINDSTYYYVITAVNRIGEGPASLQAGVYVGNKLIGKLIGTSGSYNNNSATTDTAAVDGNLNSFFDANVSSGAWVGYDFGTDSSAVVTSINYAPRIAYASRMVGGLFQGANKTDFSDAVTLLTVSSIPPYGVLTPQTVTNTGAYRYLRYLSPTGGSCNVAEIEFYGKLKSNQTITFNTLSPKTVADTDYNAGAIASSGLPISYTSSDSTVAIIVNRKIHIVAAGTSVITALQAGNNLFMPAATVSQTLTVNKLNQTIIFNTLPTKRPGDTDMLLNATSSAGLPITFTSSNSNVATIVNGQLHITGSGTSTIEALQAGNNTYSAGMLSQTLNVIPLNLQVQYQDGDNGQLTNNVIRPYLKIVNADSAGVAYNELTMRYWFTAENYSGINTWIDYAELGNSNVSMKYVQLDEPRNGALGYVEYSFAATDNLAPNSNSGQIQSRFANQDWSNLNEADDYSHQSNTNSYTTNSNVTLYRNGVLIWGTEPAVVPVITSLNVSYQNQNQNTSSNTISTYLSINNIGNVQVAYGDITARYWFTEDGTQSLNYWIDYAKKGSANINSKFVTVSPALNGADTYFEIAVNPAVGTLYPLSTTGNIQYRITKADWSNFNELNDYSYLPKDVMKLNNHITLYYKGQLIYGIEPAALISNSLVQKSDSSAFSSTVVNSDGIVVHSALSPNGDGVNDVLTIDNITSYPDNKIMVMNTGGTKVFESSGYDNTTKTFDGHSSVTGTMVPQGTYFYVLQYKAKGITKTKTGYIVLKY